MNQLEISASPKNLEELKELLAEVAALGEKYNLAISYQIFLAPSMYQSGPQQPLAGIDID